MGLFDRLRQSTSTDITLGPAEAFAGIMLLAIAADGYAATEELDLLYSTLSRMRMYRSYPNEVMRRMFDKLSGIVKRNGSDALFQAAIKVLPHDLYETIFAVATDLVLADGQVTPEEEAILQSLYKALQLDDALVNQIINVMIIKNKG